MLWLLKHTVDGKVCVDRKSAVEVGVGVQEDAA